MAFHLQNAVAAQEAVQFFLCLMVTVRRQHECFYLHFKKKFSLRSILDYAFACAATFLQTCPFAAFRAAFWQAPEKCRMFFYLFFFLKELKGKAEAEVGGLPIRRAAVPSGYAAAPCDAVPAATTVHAASARSGSRRVIND